MVHSVNAGPVVITRITGAIIDRVELTVGTVVSVRTRAFVLVDTV